LKKKKLSTLKKKADALFSRYIRRKYEKNGLISCYTCGMRHEFKRIQCGHFVSRTHTSTRWLEENARAQCFACNVWKRGNYDVFSLKLVEENGIEFLRYLQRKKNEVVRMRLRDYEALIKDLEDKLKPYE